MPFFIFQRIERHEEKIILCHSKKLYTDENLRNKKNRGKEKDSPVG